MRLNVCKVLKKNVVVNNSCLFVGSSSLFKDESIFLLLFWGVGVILPFSLHQMLY